jgi:hypothetical protein
MSWIKGYFTDIFIYLFMIAVFASIICGLSLIVFALRHTFVTVSETEQRIAHYLLIIFICSVVIIPVSLYIVDRLERLKG